MIIGNTHHVISRQLSLAGWKALETSFKEKAPSCLPSDRQRRGIPRYSSSAVCALRSCIYRSLGLIRIVSYRPEAATDGILLGLTISRLQKFVRARATWVKEEKREKKKTRVYITHVRPESNRARFEIGRSLSPDVDIRDYRSINSRSEIVPFSPDCGHFNGQPEKARRPLVDPPG